MKISGDVILNSMTSHGILIFLRSLSLEIIMSETSSFSFELLLTKTFDCVTLRTMSIFDLFINEVFYFNRDGNGDSLPFLLEFPETYLHLRLLQLKKNFKDIHRQL